MVHLTVEQNRIGRILQAGSLLLNDSSTARDVGRQIEAQMTLLNKHWEDLRVQAMDRQTRSVIVACICSSAFTYLAVQYWCENVMQKIWNLALLLCLKRYTYTRRFNCCPSR